MDYNEGQDKEEPPQTPLVHLVPSNSVEAPPSITYVCRDERMLNCNSEAEQVTPSTWQKCESRERCGIFSLGSSLLAPMRKVGQEEALAQEKAFSRSSAT